MNNAQKCQTPVIRLASINLILLQKWQNQANYIIYCLKLSGINYGFPVMPAPFIKTCQELGFESPPTLLVDDFIDLNEWARKQVNNCGQDNKKLFDLCELLSCAITGGGFPNSTSLAIIEEVLKTAKQ